CLARRGLISASRARMPPSPWLSARMMSSAYLMEMTTTSDQKISDTIPKHRFRRNGSTRARGFEGDAHRVERACPDVPQHHAHAGKCRRCQRPRGGVWASMKGADLPSRAHVSRPWGSLNVSARATAGKQESGPGPRLAGARG